MLSLCRNIFWRGWDWNLSVLVWICIDNHISLFQTQWSVYITIHTTRTPIIRTKCGPCIAIFFFWRGRDWGLTVLFWICIDNCISVLLLLELCTESHTPPAHRFLLQYAILVSQYFLEMMRLRSICPCTVYKIDTRHPHTDLSHNKRSLYHAFWDVCDWINVQCD